MTFPATPLPVLVELFVNSAWTDITTDVYGHDRGPIDITRGKPDEASRTPPSTCRFTLNNRAGTYSPRNPLGAYYGTLTRNTPIRVSVSGDYRFWGEVSAWPAEWDVTGNDAWVDIEAADILRRLGTGNRSVGTSLDDLLSETTSLAYWPLTDGAGSTTGANVAFPQFPMHLHSPGGGASVEFGVGDLGGFLPAGVNIVTTGTNSLIAAAGTGSTATSLTYEFVYKAETLGVFEFNASLSNSSVFAIWTLRLRGDGTNDDIQITLTEDAFISPTVTNLTDTAALDAITDGEVHHVRLTLTQYGTATDYTVHVDGTAVIDTTRASFTIGEALDVWLEYAPAGGDTAVAIGYVIAWQDGNAPVIADTSGAALAHIGETAGRRIERICDEQGISFVSVGDLDATTAMGGQYEDGLEGQLAEIETADQGLIYTPRNSLALAYRTRESLYNQDAAATISYSDHELAAPFQAIDDDQSVRNDVFAQRRDGASYRATKESGPLSVLDPPNGVGRYKDEVQVNVETDEMLPAIAGWLLHLGTVDEARFPRLNVDMTNPDVLANATLVADIPAVDIGDRILIENGDPVGFYDTISLLVLGYTERLNAFERYFTLNCAPASPYEIVEVDDATSRISPGDGSTVNEAMTTTETDMDVASAGFLWTTDAGQMPISILVGGEEMSVTAISGASSPQTFTVTRSVNGVVKTHGTGAIVRLKREAILGV